MVCNVLQTYFGVQYHMFQTLGYKAPIPYLVQGALCHLVTDMFL